jgi:hypothetical protein
MQEPFTVYCVVHCCWLTGTDTSNVPTEYYSARVLQLGTVGMYISSIPYVPGTSTLYYHQVLFSIYWSTS